MVCSEDTRIILVRTKRPYVQSVAAHATGTVCSRGYRWTREGANPWSLVEGLKSAESLFSCSAVCSCLSPGVVLRCVPPFIEEAEDAGHIRKKRRERKGRESRRRSPLVRRVLLLLHAGPADAVDGNRDGSTSSAGRGVLSHPGGRHGEPTCLSAAVRGLGSTTTTHPSLLAMRTPGRGLTWPRVTSRVLEV